MAPALRAVAVGGKWERKAPFGCFWPVQPCSFPFPCSQAWCSRHSPGELQGRIVPRVPSGMEILGAVGLLPSVPAGSVGTELIAHSGWQQGPGSRLGGHGDTGGTGHGLGVTVALVAPVALAGRSLVTGVCLSGLPVPWSGSSPWDWPPKDVCLDPLPWPNRVHAVPPVTGCPWHPWGSLCSFQSTQPCPVLSHFPPLGRALGVGFPLVFAFLEL